MGSIVYSCISGGKYTDRRDAPRGPDFAALPFTSPGRNSEEMPAVLPVDWIPTEEAQAQLVDQLRRLKADARSLAGQITGRHAVQLVVDEGQHVLERVGLAVAPGPEQLRDLATVPVRLVGSCEGPEPSLAELPKPSDHLIPHRARRRARVTAMKGRRMNKRLVTSQRWWLFRRCRQSRAVQHPGHQADVWRTLHDSAFHDALASEGEKR